MENNIFILKICFCTLLLSLACETKKESSKKIPLFEEKEDTYYKITGEDSLFGNKYESKNISYETLNIYLKGESDFAENYLLKETKISNSFTLAEENNQVIKVELFSMKKPFKKVFSFKDSCDEIKFKQGYFLTKKYACCGGEDKLKLFDFHNKQLIIQGDREIQIGTLPNSFDFYFISFEKNQSKNDVLGTLHLVSSLNKRYDIEIKCKSKEKCTPFAPQTIVKPDSNVSQKEFYSNSAEELGLKKSFNILEIDLEFECEQTKTNKIEIPLINGLPLGKNNKLNTIELK